MRRADFHFHLKCQELRITHLAYADDLLLFSRGDRSSTRVIMGCLEQFEMMEGLRPNLNKSCIYMAGLEGDARQELLTITGFQEGHMSYRYLGIPLASEKLKITDYGPLMDALSRKISIWPKLTLSYAGRVQLIQSVLQGVECYWMSILPLPMGVVERYYGEYMISRMLSGFDGFITLTYRTDIWRWRNRHTDSPLLKRLVQIRDRMVTSVGSVQMVQQTLAGWFGQASSTHRGVSQAYDFFRDTGARALWTQTVWRKHIQPSHSFTLWLLAHRRLPTKDRLEYLGEADRICLLCGSKEETQDHLFFGCPQIRWIWDCIRDWLHMTQDDYASTDVVGVRAALPGDGDTDASAPRCYGYDDTLCLAGPQPVAI
ncbi:uncharacterized protein LOC121993799 [Zingiber officinale]|uniref:uncharacterized protein LOC121993799 n=1 Tax=Zingiber officinale TaxID=94328 RepID=UPI001C4AA9F1|nr:uncharacterized protein LOC121993799 [Zingiber officinale]